MLDLDSAIEIAIPKLKIFESFRSRAYPDQNGVWTIGYGHTAGVKPGMKMSVLVAEKLLVQDTEQIAQLLEPHLPEFLNPNQFAALISLAYNIGPGKAGARDGFLIQKSGEPSTILKKLTEGAPAHEIGDCFLSWIYVGDEASSGLCSRRTRERELFLTPYEPNS